MVPSGNHIEAWRDFTVNCSFNILVEYIDLVFR